MQGAKKDGALGFAKGLAKGTVGLITKPGAGTCFGSHLKIPCLLFLIPDTTPR